VKVVFNRVYEVKAMANKQFEFRKAQIERYVKAEYDKKFRKTARISIRKRHKFMNDMARKVSKKFGKDVLCLIDFSRGGFFSLISPSHTKSTDLGRLFDSFTHTQVAYTSHCLERFSKRTDSNENCIIKMDSYITDALLTYGENLGHLTCSSGVFAYEVIEGRLIVKTYINFDLLSEEQIDRFYGSGTATVLLKECITDDHGQTDFKLAEE
jgi:hypothetical protein|tara:strand:+ start:94 stop:726 length:633 start_codon:yes stop_codon:yes gene_type:complete